MEELARLTPAQVRVARAVAVLGGAGSIAAVAAVSGIDSGEVVDHLDAIAAAGLLDGGPVLRIRNRALEKLVVAHGGPDAARSAYARAARHAHESGDDTGRTAALLLDSWPIGERWATEALLASARAARRTANAVSARAFADRAQAENAGSDAALGELGTIRAWAALQLDPAPDAVARAEAILAEQEQAGRYGWADRTRADLVEFAMLTGETDLACTHARALVAAAGDDLERQARGLRALLGATYLEPGAEDERLAAVRGAGRLLASGREDALPVLAHAAVTFASVGLDAQAGAAVEQVRRARFERHPRLLVEIGLAGVALVQLERLDEAARVFADVAAAASWHGIADLAANARTWFARIAGWLGDATAARAAAAELADGQVWPVLRPVAAAALLAGVLLDGSDGEVAEALDAGRAELAGLAVPRGPGVADLLLGCARAEHALGRPAAVAESVARRHGLPPWRLAGAVAADRAPGGGRVRAAADLRGCRGVVGHPGETDHRRSRPILAGLVDLPRVVYGSRRRTAAAAQ